MQALTAELPQDVATLQSLVMMQLRDMVEIQDRCRDAVLQLSPEADTAAQVPTA